MKRIVALTSSSLLVQGLVSRLRGYNHGFDISMVEPTCPKARDQIIEFRPDVIIFDEGELKTVAAPSLVDILNSLPDVVFLELRLDDPDVQLIQSTRFKASSAEELVQIFKTDGSVSAYTNAQ